MLYGNNRFVYNNHYPTHKASEVFLSNNATTAINTNHDLRFGTRYTHLDDTRDKILGYHLTPRGVNFSKHTQGIKIEPLDNQPFYINLPVEKYRFDHYLSRSGYYRCGLGDKYLLNIAFEPEVGDVQISYKVMDLHHTVCYQQDQWLSGKQHKESLQFDIQIPEKLDIKPSDHRIYLFVSIRFDNNPASFFLKEISLQPQSTAENTTEKLQIAGQEIEPVNGRHTVALNKASTQITTDGFVLPKTLYVKSPNAQWQVRNATATINADGLTIDQLRYRFSQHNHVIITPVEPPKYYVNELIDISSCRISYVDDSVIIRNITREANAALVLVSEHAPIRIKGAELTQVNPSSYLLKVLNDEVVLAFSA